MKFYIIYYIQYASILLTFPPQYNWNIVKSGVKHHNPNPLLLSFNYLL
jgi:hypothetical protein